MKPKGAKSIPTAIGPFPVLKVLEVTAMGTVYQGHDPLTHRNVAIKVLPEEALADPVLRMRFAQECQVLRNLMHPNCVRVLDFGLDGSTAYLILEYVDGDNLGQRLERDGRLPEAEAVRLITQVGQALEYLHRKRVIHRDVKPDNILVTADGQAKLTDLGLAKNLDGDFNLTLTQSALGTPHFMAPEQFEDAKRVDARGDLYSLAATLYMLVTNQPPFRTRSARAVGLIYKKKMALDLAPPREVVPELSEDLERAVLKALHPDRNQRHASVEEFLADLTGAPALQPESPPTAPADPEQAPLVEARVEDRFSARCETSCQPLQRAPDQAWVGQVVNVSQNGVCLKLKRRFELGAFLRVALIGKNTRRQSMVARVVWVKQDSPDTWRLGCRFDRPLSEGELQGLC
jgi:serine/threonine protein kinase